MRNMFFDQRSPRHPEVGVSQWRRQTEKQTDGYSNSMTESTQRADLVKIGYLLKGMVHMITMLARIVIIDPRIYKKEQ